MFKYRRNFAAGKSEIFGLGGNKISGIFAHPIGTWGKESALSLICNGIGEKKHFMGSLTFWVKGDRFSDLATLFPLVPSITLISQTRVGCRLLVNILERPNRRNYQPNSQFFGKIFSIIEYTSPHFSPKVKLELDLLRNDCANIIFCTALWIRD